MAGATVIAAAVGEAIRSAAVQLRPDVSQALDSAIKTERSDRGRRILSQLAENARISARDRVPLCQDTGTVWVWVELGAGESLSADLYARINDAVADAYRDANLRMSVVGDALFDRVNTGDNTPAFIDVTLREDEGTRVHVMLKGGGSDNASVVEMLSPSVGSDGVLDLVVRQVERKAASACPPLVIGVGVGGTFDGVPKLAKRALLRPVGVPNPDSVAAEFEKRVLEAVNATGIGPGGLGGDTTALAVHLNTAPCHIAALPVAVNLGCSAMRSVSIDVD